MLIVILLIGLEHSKVGWVASNDCLRGHASADDEDDDGDDDADDDVDDDVDDDGDDDDDDDDGDGDDYYDYDYDDGDYHDGIALPMLGAQKLPSRPYREVTQR